MKLTNFQSVNLISLSTFFLPFESFFSVVLNPVEKMGNESGALNMFICSRSGWCKFSSSCIMKWNALLYMRCMLWREKIAKSTCWRRGEGKEGRAMILKYAFMFASLRINVSELSFKIALISATWQRNLNVNIFMMQNWCQRRFISNALEMIYAIGLRTKRIKKCSCKDEILHAIWSAWQIMPLRK